QRFTDAGAMEKALAGSMAAPGPGAARTSRPWIGWWPAAVAAALLVVTFVALRTPSRRATPAMPPPAATRMPRSAPPAAPGPVAAEPSPAPAATALAIDATLMRGTGDDARAVADGAQIATGDHLFLQLSSPTPAWVYVLDEDRTGATVVMFPVAGTDLANPL